MKNKKTTWLLISLAASFLLWLYVVTVVSPEKTETFYNIPVVFTGEDVLRDEGLTISHGSDARVMLRLTGTRSVIDQLSEDTITITIDVSKIRSAGDYTRSYSIAYPNSIQPSSVTIERKSPNNISFTVSELEHKEVPIQTVFEGSLAADYTLKSIKPSFDTITVTGTLEQIEEIKSALIIVDQQDLAKSTTRNMRYTLVDFNGEPIDDSEIEVDEETVEVTITVVKNKVLPLAIELIPGGGMTEEHVAWEFDPPSITVSGDEDVLESLNKITMGSIDLATVVADTAIDYPIVLPDGVENETGVVQATLTMKLSGLSMTTFRVVDFEFINVPEGYHAEPMTQSLQISVRGPSDEINLIEASDIRVVADLSSLIGISGNYTCDNVAVYLSGYENSGVMGSYDVVVKLMTEEDYLSSLAEATEAASDDTAEATEGS